MQKNGNQLCSPGLSCSLSSQTAHSVPQSSVCGLTLLLVQKLAHNLLSGGTAQNIGVHSMCSWERRVQHPPELPCCTCLERSGFDCCISLRCLRVCTVPTALRGISGPGLGKIKPTSHELHSSTLIGYHKINLGFTWIS